MKRKIVSIVLALALCLSLLPGAARAEGVTVTTYSTQPPTTLESNKYYITNEDGGLERKDSTDGLTDYLEYKDGALTVHGSVSLSATSPTLMISGGTLTIKGGDGASLTLTSSAPALNISNGGSVQLEGGVNLTINTGSPSGAFSATENYSGDITITGTSSSPAVSGNLIIQNAGNVTIKNEQGMAVAGKLTVENAASVKVSGGGSSPAITGGADINSTGDVNLASSNSTAVNGNLTVKSGGSVTITGGAENGAPALTGDISIEAGGDISITDRNADKDYSSADLTLTSENGTISVKTGNKLIINGESWVENTVASGGSIDLTNVQDRTRYVTADGSIISYTPAEDGGGTLTLDNVTFDGTVILPDNTVTIEVEGDCRIKKLAGGSAPYQTKITIAPVEGKTGTLTVEERINIAGGNYGGNSLTIEAGACLDVKKDVYIGGDGGVNGTITVKGTLIADGGTGWAVSSGQVIVGRNGTLEVSGGIGVSSSGMSIPVLDDDGNQVKDENGTPVTESVYTGAFTLETDGTFISHCSGAAISVSAGGESTFKDSVEPSTVISTPPDYLPANCEPEFANDKKDIVIANGNIVISSDNLPHTITIIRNPNEGGTVSAPSSARKNATVTLTAAANDGYTFTGWTSSDVSINGNTFTMPGRNVTITANWTKDEEPEPTKYTITVISGEGGTAAASAAAAEAGAEITLTATPDAGYAFNGWTSSDVTITGNTFTMPEKDVTITANWTKNQTTPPVYPAYPGSYPAAPAAQPAKPSTPSPAQPAQLEPETGCDGGAACPTRAYRDLAPGKWYHEATDYVLRSGLMDGYPSGEFGPDDVLTRAQLAQILYNRAGKPAVTIGNMFTDVKAGDWYAPAVTWAASQGIVTGYGDGRFGPDDKITREQLAVMLWRSAGSPPAAAALNFTDAELVSGYAREALSWAVANGVCQGYGDGRLDPGGLTTRVQAAQMLYNLYGK